MEDRDATITKQDSLWQVVRKDFSEASGLRLLAVAGVLVWMGFQWGWGNDILLPPIVANVFDAVDDGITWTSAIVAPLVATAAGSTFWAITQTLDGIIVLSGLRMLPGITQRISSYVGKTGWLKPYAELSLGTRFLIAYASGASLLCLIDVFATGEQGWRPRKRMLAEAVALAVAGVAIAVVVVTGVTAIGRRVPATTAAADTFVRYASNPLTWLVFYGSIIGLSALVARFQQTDDGDQLGVGLNTPS